MDKSANTHCCNRISLLLKPRVMKKIIYFLAIGAAFTACKPKATLNTDKEVVSLTDSSFYNSSYLTDTGAVADPDAFISSGGVISGKNTVPDQRSNAVRTTRSNSNSGTYNTGSRSQGSTASAPATTQRSGMSKAAKGAIIGGVGGAVAGAVIGKNAKGAGIGAVVGAAGGYIIGRSKDRKDGRVRN
ncbi:MAG: hypothetical protein EOO03_10925 [Chitinophagaceae bacterium]|nr:MAG: hypothetical protein EOO03_10925 [Chitinophagaceae bacterium]